MPPLIDLRDHFGIWEHCGNSKWWRRVPWNRRNPDSERVYVNPIDGLMISAYEYPQVPGQAWRVTVRDGQKASDLDEAIDALDNIINDIDRLDFESVSFPSMMG